MIGDTLEPWPGDRLAVFLPLPMADQLTQLYLTYFGGVCLALVAAFGLARGSRFVDRSLFWMLGLVLVAFTAWRPFGSGLDDAGHFNLHYAGVCPLFECERWLPKERDYLWYFLVAGLKTVSSHPADMLWLSAAVVLGKLLLIDRLCHWRLMALTLYAGAFYQVQDMTSFRQSWAILLFLLGFWGMVRYSPGIGGPLLFAAGFAHKQGFLSVTLLPAAWLPRRWYWPQAMLVTALLLMLLGCYPSSRILQTNVVYIQPGSWLQLLRSLVEQTSFSRGGWSVLTANIPLSSVPMMGLVLFVFRRGWPLADRVYVYGAFSAGLAFLWLWLYLTEPVYQFRFFYFFLTPLILVVGRRQQGALFLCMVMAVALAFTLRYNVWHRLFIDTATVRTTIQGPGSVVPQGQYGLPCGAQCETIGIGRVETFEAIPGAGQALSGWGGACSGREPRCNVTVSGDTWVSARFVPGVEVDVQVVGSGQVISTPAGLACGNACRVRFAQGLPITLAARPGRGYRLAGWEGACQTAEPTCFVMLGASHKVVARFERVR